MADNDRGRERDLVLAPNEFAFISDETKGNINVYVGPHKTSLANTDRPVVFNPQTKRFDRCSLEQAIQTMAVAPEGWYVVLKNPSKDGTFPRTGALNNLPELNIGRKLSIPGPISFARWPGQMVKVLQGHHLRSNQYLVVRVYDEEAAKKNWKDAVFKPRSKDGVEIENDWIRMEDLTMGKLLLIKGTDVSFHIPPTGIEVVPDESSQYVREAVTLERLEYCILRDEDGNKRFICGPAVVFPRPTESFVEKKGGVRKYRAIELNENSGIYVKVIAPYEENGVNYKVGDELFITGKEQMIYFPRSEHAIIKYHDQEIHYAIAIPEGEGRYVLDRNKGKIALQKGPSIFLPDPRKEVIVRRVLDSKSVSLWYPGNAEALAVNQKLLELKQASGVANAPLEEKSLRMSSVSNSPQVAKTQSVPTPSTFAGDDFSRGQQYTPPRSIVLDTKYDGAVTITVWTGYAVMVVKKNGERRVIVGPQTYLLEYDETLQTLELSSGIPKNDSKLHRTVYLRVLNNKVSDVVEVETRDLCRANIAISYRVSFEGEPEKWFDVENYVKFLTDHLRSLIRHAVKQIGIESFYANAAGILRDSILGSQNENGRRLGRLFLENGMRIYDAEVLDVQLGDEAISRMLVEAQHEVIRKTLSIESEKRKLEYAKEVENTKQQIQELQAGSKYKELSLKMKELEQTQSFATTQLNYENSLKQIKQIAQKEEQSIIDEIHQIELERKKSVISVELGTQKTQLEYKLQERESDVRAVVEKAKAISPDLIAALESFSDKALAERVAQSMAPLAILGGESVADVFSKLIQGTPLSNSLAKKAFDMQKK